MNKVESLDGTFELGIVDKLDAKNFRGSIRSLSTGGIQTAVFNPSPYFGVMPEVGEVVSVYKRHGWSARYMLPIARPNSDTPESRLVNESKAGDIPTMSPGDMFVGQRARLFFDRGGNATLSNFQGNLSLQLNDSTQKVNLSATNFSLSTPGCGIRVQTKSSIPTTFGDIFRIEKNVPLPEIPEELIGFTPLSFTEISSFEIDALGGMTLSSVGGLAKLRLSSASLPFEPFTPGNIRLENPLAKLKLDATGSVFLGNNAGSISMDPIGNGSIDSVLSKFEVNAAGTSKWSGTVLTLQAPSVAVTGNVKIDGTLQVVGVMMPTGVPAVVPLLSVSTIAKVPVMVNGVLAGFIPIIP